MSTPTTDHGFLDRLRDAADAAAFVHVGDRFDPDALYLTRFHGPDRPYAFVATGSETTLCAPALFAEQARREFAGDRVIAHDGEPTPEARAAARLDSGATVAVLERSSARTLARLEDAGLEVVTVDAGPLREARRRKTPAERDRHRAVHRTAQAGMRRAEAVLAGSTVDGAVVRWEGEPLTTERLRRAVNAELARHGVTDAGNTVVGAGPTCADLHFVGDDAVRPDETVLLDVSPRGPAGYYGDCSRTFVPGTVRETERAWYDAVDAALEAALDALAPGAGVEGAAVREAVTETLAAHGFDGGSDARMTHGPGHGVGLSLHEAPGYDGPLRAGDVVTVEPGLYDPDRGGVRLEELVVVGESGVEVVGDYPRSPAPRA